MSSLVWQCGEFHLSLEAPLIMAIVNVTPDSFSGDGFGRAKDSAMTRAEKVLHEGAAIIDIGGESSRPGADAVSVQEELDRVLPVVEGLRDCGVPLSVDTVKPEVMREAIACGASIINDITALNAPAAVDVVRQTTAGVCLMHMQGQPGTMQQKPAYTNVAEEVADYLLQRAAALELVGVSSSRIALDPGFGFGKSLQHNCELFRSMPLQGCAGYPLLVGVSRKTMLGELSGLPVSERALPSVVAAVLAVQHGAHIVRVHDVAATRAGLAVWAGLAADQT